MQLIPKERHSTDSKILLCVSVDSACHGMSFIYNSKLHICTYYNTDDNNRIFLKSIPEAADCQSDYINACYIDVRLYHGQMLTYPL